MKNFIHSLNPFSEMKGKPLKELSLLDWLRFWIVIDIIVSVISLLIPGIHTLNDYIMYAFITFVLIVILWTVKHYQTNKFPYLFIAFSIVLIILIPYIPRLQNTGSSSQNPEATVEPKTSYQKTLTAFERNTNKQFKDKLAEGYKFYIFVGQEDCKACKKFAPHLRKASKEKQQIVYYFDAAYQEKETEKILHDLKITKLPALVQISKGQVVERFDMKKADSLEAIEDFLTDYSGNPLIH